MEEKVFNAEEVINFCRDAGLDDEGIIKVLNDAIALLHPEHPEEEEIDEEAKMKEVFGAI